jgi:hypothetical protein
MKIINITKSDKKNKRFKVFLNDGSEYDFGLKNPKYGTYIDHNDKNKRFLYWNRHYANKTERHLIDNFIASPSMFSAYILWGKYPSIKKNVEWLNKKINKDQVL